MAKVTLAFIEDDELFRSFLEAIFGRHSRYEIVGSFASGDAALSGLGRNGADVAIVDLRLDGASGITTLRALQRRWPRMQCVVLTGSDLDEDLFAALKAGAVGYLLKSDDAQLLLARIDEVVSGGVALSRSIARRIVGSFSASRRTEPPAAAPMTRRECEIMDELALGHTYKEIALKLGVSPATVKNHLYRIYEKLGVRSRTEAVVRWLRR